jgi:hypothetical protein
MSFDPNHYESDLLNDKPPKKQPEELKKNIPIGGFPKHKPLVTPNLSSGAAHGSSKPTPKV